MFCHVVLYCVAHMFCDVICVVFCVVVICVALCDLRFVAFRVVVLSEAVSKAAFGIHPSKW